jgi:hypothetical protein
MPVETAVHGQIDGHGVHSGHSVAESPNAVTNPSVKADEVA